MDTPDGLTAITLHYTKDGRHFQQHIDPGRAPGLAFTAEVIDRMGWEVELDPDCDAVGPAISVQEPIRFGDPRVAWGICLIDPVTGRIVCVAHPLPEG